MQITSLSFESGYLWIPIGLLIGLVYASMLYYRSTNPWSKNLNLILGFIRFSMVVIICLLLANIFLKQKKINEEPPIVGIAIDNSLSVQKALSATELASLNKNINQLKNSLENSGVKVVLSNINGEELDDIPKLFTKEKTDLSKTLNTFKDNYNDRGLAAVALISDGIYNQGSAPEYGLYTYPIFTMGVGDTITKSDLLIQDVFVNKVSYQGNQFPVLVNVKNTGFKGEKVQVSVRKNGRIIKSTNLLFQKDQEVHPVEFLIEAKQAGIQKFEIAVDYIDGEFQKRNNFKSFFIEIIEGKQKVLVLADAPHPDLNAIKQSLEENENYEVSIHFYKFKNDIEMNDPDLLVLYQIPNKSLRMPSEWNRIISREIPRLMITGTKTNLQKWNAFQNNYQLAVSGFDFDYVTPTVDQDFNLFNLTDKEKSIIQEWIPVQVPYGKYNNKTPTATLLSQNLNGVQLNKPIISFSKEENPKHGYIFGQGIWKWRLQEFAEHESHEVFNNVIQRIVQYLVSNESKKQFRVYPSKNKLTETDRIVFNSEVYNQVFEPIYGNEISLNVKNLDTGVTTETYTFVPSVENKTFILGALSEGAYQFNAETTIEGVVIQSKGQFVVEKLDLELRNLNADFIGLRSLAQKTSGSFTTLGGFEKWKDNLLSIDKKSKMNIDQSWTSIIDLYYIFLLITALVTIEWFLRKFNGGI